MRLPCLTPAIRNRDTLRERREIRDRQVDHADRPFDRRQRVALVDLVTRLHCLRIRRRTAAFAVENEQPIVRGDDVGRIPTDRNSPESLPRHRIEYGHRVVSRLGDIQP